MALTQNRLRELFNYDPATGQFERLLPPSRRNPSSRAVKAGSLTDKGYIAIYVDGKYIKAHRAAFLWMTGEWPVNQVDHVNGVKSDNRWSNLREADNSQNQANITARWNNPVGLKGAHRAARGKWTSRVCIRGERHFLGLFEAPEAAHLAYCAAVEKLNPEFGRAV